MDCGHQRAKDDVARPPFAPSDGRVGTPKHEPATSRERRHRGNRPSNQTPLVLDHRGPRAVRRTSPLPHRGEHPRALAVRRCERRGRGEGTSSNKRATGSNGRTEARLPISAHPQLKARPMPANDHQAELRRQPPGVTAGAAVARNHSGKSNSFAPPPPGKMNRHAGGLAASAQAPG